MESKPALEPLSTSPPRGALMTFMLFLCGNGDAIRRLAATPRLWLVGLLFTFSAGLAREYDAEDLLTEPWHLLIAPGASWAAATVLWVLVQVGGFRRWMWSPAKPQTSSTHPDDEPEMAPPPADPPPAPRLRDNYLAFLGLFWLTAPLAWFYGIPFERFQSEGQAASSNLWLLTLIALWRVVLMVRVLQVVYGIGGVVASITVLFFGNALMLAALFAMPVPVFVIMGGVRLGPADQSLAFLAFAGKIVGTISLCLLSLLWACTFLDRKRWSWMVATTAVRLKPLTVVAVVAIAWWCAWLPFTQPQQRLRGQVERALLSGDFATGLGLLARHPVADFPPHWDPPPRVGYHQREPEVVEVLLYLVDHPLGGRCQAVYEDKLLRMGWDFDARFGRAKASLERLVTLLERMPDASHLMHPSPPPDARRRHYGLADLLAQIGRDTHPSLRSRIDAVLERYPGPTN
jgi:hypothetical protein